MALACDHVLSAIVAAIGTRARQKLLVECSENARIYEMSIISAHIEKCIKKSIANSCVKYASTSLAQVEIKEIQ